ncbi:Uncharacterized protein Adt_22042 [Abeliophyllum distichum]|uniref:Reverse transcriptase n=1 Tax=Abeliophyllum distichum TaxID=126358 RepID=A0ABD1T137_9LAMI
MTLCDIEMTEALEETPKDTTMEEAVAPENIDPRITGIDSQTSLIEELENFPVDPNDPTRKLQVGQDLFEEPNEAFEKKRRPLNLEKYDALKEDVGKLLRSNFIREAQYPKWVSNPVLVKKPSGKMRTCIDFSNLNQACPKDSFPLPQIDQLVDATFRHDLLSFMDAYSRYNQISMYPSDEEHTSFVTDKRPLLLQSHALRLEKCRGYILEACQQDVCQPAWLDYGSICR